MRRVLKEAKYVTLAMCREGRPYLVSLNHGYDEEQNCIYFHCAGEGKKLEYLRANNLVWGQALIDHGFFAAPDDCRQNYATVMFEGKVTFVEDPEEKRHAFLILNSHLEAPSEGLRRILDENLARTTVGKVSLEYVSGKKSKEISL